ncbi:hypothetical protein [Helicobacter pylori]|uniref:hypothetical protein n=1 Tax=Helicobacter pylori TaxID=210 RepID=UPI001E40C4E2|nr:hypothetical protein [Helicobacter pylori]
MLKSNERATIEILQQKALTSQGAKRLKGLIAHAMVSIYIIKTSFLEKEKN